MNAAAEAEVTAVHGPGAEIATYTATVVEEYRPRIVMAPEDAKALDDQLRACMLAVLREGVDYGTIPGSDKPSLLKPGAEKLLQWFGFGHTLEATETERDADGRWVGVTYRCTVIKGMPDGRDVVVATCDGYAGYDEDRFYTSAEQAEAKERYNAEKYRRAVNPLKFAEYRAPRNSVVKMAEKRAMVGAALQATSASSLFTQDMEDLREAAAPADAEGAKFRTAAMGALMALDGSIREGVGRWYRGKGWPDPREWSPEQWCAALQAAGFIAGQRSAQQAAAQPVQTTVEPSAAEEAMARLEPGDSWTEKVRDISSEEEGRAVLAELAGSAMDGWKAHLISEAILARFPDAGSESAVAA